MYVLLKFKKCFSLKCLGTTLDMSIKLILKCAGVLGRGGWGKGGRPKRSVRSVMSLAHSLPPPETRESRINGSEKKKGWKFRQELQALKREEKLRT